MDRREESSFAGAEHRHNRRAVTHDPRRIALTAVTPPPGSELKWRMAPWAYAHGYCLPRFAAPNTSCSLWCSPIGTTMRYRATRPQEHTVPGGGLATRRGREFNARRHHQEA